MDDKSIWKKEISFKRKAKADAPADAKKQDGETVWKKEISFKRKAKDATVEAKKPAGESIWKKDVSLKRKAKLAAAQSEAVALEPVAVEPEPVAVEPELPSAVQHVLEPVALEPVAEPESEPVASYDFLTEAEPAADDQPVAAAAEPWAAPPTVPPAPVAVPEIAEAPTVEVAAVHPPVPAAELPPLASDAKSTPFWKRGLSLGGRGDAKPKAEKPAKEKNQKQPKAERQLPQKRQKAPKVKVERGGGGGKKLVGLKIGASQLAAARVSNNGAAELMQVAREPLDAGIVVGGELRDPDALAEALKEFFDKHKLPKKGVRLGIANNRIGVRTFEIAGIEDEKQMTNAIKFRAQEALPIPIDEAVLDYQILGESVDAEGQSVRRVLLVVAYKEQIDRYVDACKKAGIGLDGIDLEAFALLRALQAPQTGAGDDPTAALVAVAIGHERSTFAVSDGRVCEFTRVLEWGGAALNVAVARALDAAPSEVEGVKRSLSLLDEETPEGLTADQAAKARDAVRRAIQMFARELVSSLQFYQNQPGSLGIGEIVLTGGTAHLPGLAGELERLIGVHVRVGDPLARMKVSKRVGEPEQIGSLAVAIGLGIED